MRRVRSRIPAEFFPIGAWCHALLLAEGFGENFGIPVTAGKSDCFDGEIRIRQKLERMRDPAGRKIILR